MSGSELDELDELGELESVSSLSQASLSSHDEQPLVRGGPISPAACTCSSPRPRHALVTPSGPVPDQRASQEEGARAASRKRVELGPAARQVMASAAAPVRRSLDPWVSPSPSRSQSAAGHLASGSLALHSPPDDAGQADALLGCEGALAATPALALPRSGQAQPMEQPPACMQAVEQPSGAALEVVKQPALWAPSAAAHAVAEPSGDAFEDDFFAEAPAMHGA